MERISVNDGRLIPRIILGHARIADAGLNECLVIAIQVRQRRRDTVDVGRRNHEAEVAIANDPRNGTVLRQRQDGTSKPDIFVKLRWYLQRGNRAGSPRGRAMQPSILSDSSWLTGSVRVTVPLRPRRAIALINVEDRCDLTHKIETDAVARDAAFVKTLRQAFEATASDRELRRDFPRV